MSHLVIKGNGSRFRFVRETRWKGVVKIYADRISGRFIAVSRSNTFDRGDETMSFLYDAENDEVLNWIEITAGYGETHEEQVARIEAELKGSVQLLEKLALEA